MMKKVITRMLAIAALLLCGGAWATHTPTADENGTIPLYWWTFDAGDFNGDLRGSVEMQFAGNSNGSFELSDAGKAYYKGDPFINKGMTGFDVTASFTMVGSFKLNLEEHNTTTPKSRAILAGIGWNSNCIAMNADATHVYLAYNSSRITGADFTDAKKSIASTKEINTDGYHSYAMVYDQPNKTIYLYVDGVEVLKQTDATITNNNWDHKTSLGLASFGGGGEDGNIDAGRTKTRCDDLRFYQSILTPEQLKKIAATTYLHNDAKAAYSANFDVVSSEANRSLTASSKLGGTAITPNTSGQRGDWKNEAPTLVASGYDGVNKAMKIKSGQTPYQEGNIVGNADFSLLAVAKMTPATTSPKVIVSVGDASWDTGKKGITLAYFNKTIHVIAWDKSATGSPNFPAAISVSDIPWVESTYHAYLLTYNNTSKVVNLFVDGELKGTKTIDFAPGRTGYQIGGIFGGAGQIKLSVGGENKACAMGDDIYIDEVGIWTKDATSFAKAACVINPVWPMASDDFQWKPSVTAQTVLSYTGNQLQDASGADANIVENGRIFFNSDAEVVIPDTVTVGELIANSGTLKVRKGSSSGVFRGERIVVNPGATLNIDYINNNAPVFPVDTETTIVLNGGSVDSSGWPTVEGAVNFETLVDTTIWSATVCSTGKIIKSGDATLTLGAWLTNRDGDGHPHDVEIKAGTLKLNNAANTVRNLTIAAGASLDFNGSSGSLTIEGKLAVNSADCFTIPSTFTLDTDATVAIASGTLKSTRNDLTIVDVPQGYKAVCSETVDEHNLYTYSFLPLTASVTVGETTTNYVTLSEAITAANAVDAKDNKVMVTLLANSSDAISIDEFVTVELNEKNFSGKVSGSGTIIYTGAIPTLAQCNAAQYDSNEEWTGTVVIKNFGSVSDGHVNSPLNNVEHFGRTGSKVKFCGVLAYMPNANVTCNYDLILENPLEPFLDFAGAWRNDNGYSDNSGIFEALSGSGDFNDTYNSCRPQLTFKDASRFTGGLVVSGKRFVIGDANDLVKNDANAGRIVVKADKLVNIASQKIWTAHNGITVNGTIKGSGTLGSNTTFGDGATIDLTDGTLAMASAKSVTFSGALNLGSATVGATVLSGVSTVSTYPTSVTIAGNSDYKLTLDGDNLKVVELPDVAMIGEQGFKTLAKAFEAASADETVTLCANVSGDLSIPVNKKVDAGAYTIGGAIEIGEGSTLTMSFTNERASNGISGRGTLILNGNGTLDAKNKSSGYAVDGTTIQINAGTFKFYTGTNGGYSSGASDATTRNATFEIGASGNIANYGWVNFVGDLTFSYSGVSEKSVFGGVSFRGKPNLIKDGSGTLNFNASPNDANSDCFASVAIKAGTLKVRNNIVALPGSGSISGPGTLDADLTFGDGASVNLNTDALTLGSGRTLRFGASINLVKTEDIAEDTVVLQGLSSEIAGLSLVDVTINGAAVENGRLYYDNGVIKYTVAAAETWTPNTAALDTNKILDWTAEDAWLNANGSAATWNFSESSMKPNVQIDATTVKGVKIAGQVYVGMVVVSGTLGAGESFQFHSRLYSPSSEVTVDGTHEIDDAIDCLHTEGVNLASLNGELGMKVPITGPIAFGSNTRLVFATGSKGGDASKAYGYTFVDRGGYITVRGAGKFIVPSSMQALAFSIEETATAIYRGPGDTIGTLTGTGTIELQNGKTLALNPASGQTLHYVSAGTTANTLSWVGNGNTAISNNDSKEKPLVRVESGATLNIYGHDYAGWNGKLGNHSWFVNNGTIVFQRDGDNSRFWRDHIVLGNGSKVKIDTSSRHILLYGGAGSVDNCQIMLESGSATIEAGVTNQGKDRQSLYFGNDGGGTYGDDEAAGHGAGISVGSDATLTVSVPVAGGDALTKWGAGALVLQNVADYTGTITLKDGSLKVPAAAFADGKVTTDITGKVVKKVVNGDTTVTYSLIDATPDHPITPDSGDVVIPVVPDAGIAIQPGADVTVPPTTDASKIEVKYGDTVLSGNDGVVAVAVNAETGKIELSIKPEKENEVRPKVNAMAAPTEASTDKVAFTITSPIPGLFYSIVSGDSFDSNGDLVVDGNAEKGTSQATDSSAKTVSIPMTFTDGKKVKYYKVNVKATK